MPSLIPYRVKELHGSASERAALLSDISAAGILEAQDLEAFMTELGSVLDDADAREREAFEVKITETFDRLIDRHPALADELFDACKELIEAVR